MKPTAKVLKPSETTCPVSEGYVLVEFHWNGVDRPCTYGISCTEKDAPRLVAACNDGVLFSKPTVSRDSEGKTYVNATCNVLGRHLNADLRKLGY